MSFKKILLAVLLSCAFNAGAADKIEYDFSRDNLRAALNMYFARDRIRDSDITDEDMKNLVFTQGLALGMYDINSVFWMCTKKELLDNDGVDRLLSVIYASDLKAEISSDVLTIINESIINEWMCPAGLDYKDGEESRQYNAQRGHIHASVFHGLIARLLRDGVLPEEDRMSFFYALGYIYGIASYKPFPGTESKCETRSYTLHQLAIAVHNSIERSGNRSSLLLAVMNAKNDNWPCKITD